MLKGEKIYLRLLEKRDILMLHKLCNEEEVKKYNIISSDINEDKNNLKQTNLRKALSIINEKNVLVGFITYKESDYCQNVYSIGITIGSRYWNRSYGQDSIKVLLKYLFEELNAIRVELEVIKSNFRAINCYKKCGFRECGIRYNRCCIDGSDVDTVIMSIRNDKSNI
ncbi:GNAT family N-acetyltransferase [Clostridium saccharobutylicum]|nr:GNAT family protein [Clostridium saccharobutylicum]AQR88382.1 spermidine N(1)-acetyltransferase [Clostridium saccharobutylicum]AQR98280.1 spermidine N(1)-acetyltransferase [Clostridium saccharobutylicum]AQS07974.1 spermidine N(1)-acetyltransferase [Clostridium saccharobutylicum]AQS12270.1 spermidine N(1)-acetyltransferase [Clostridium saccharobutylicum]MBA2906088.1 RimJ/RimL family protein N-acetyltransferase [Clostridium saccharobutylicum]